MDQRILKLKTPEACEVFANNARGRGRGDLAREANRRALELNATTHGAVSHAEKECLQAIYAYERVLTARNRRTTRASRTWPMIDRHGILGAVEGAVTRSQETAGYKALLDMGLEEYAFEAVVLRYPELFSAEAVAVCKDRAEEWAE